MAAAAKAAEVMVVASVAVVTAAAAMEVVMVEVEMAVAMAVEMVAVAMAEVMAAVMVAVTAVARYRTALVRHTAERPSAAVAAFATTVAVQLGKLARARSAHIQSCQVTTLITETASLGYTWPRPLHDARSTCSCFFDTRQSRS